MTGSKSAETQPGVVVSAGDQGAAPIPTDGPPCPRRSWFSRHRDHPDHPQDPEQASERGRSRWQCWLRHRAPTPAPAPADGQELDGKQMPAWMQWRQRMEESGEWPPKDWQQWRQQWHKHCGRHKRTPYVAARVPLDDSRWLEDFYDWH